MGTWMRNWLIQVVTFQEEDKGRRENLSEEMRKYGLCQSLANNQPTNLALFLASLTN